MTGELRDEVRLSKYWLPLITGLALGLRMGLAWLHPVAVAAYPDAQDYDALAKAILNHAPYSVGGNIASRMPGYPVFVAAVYALTHDSLAWVLAVQAILGTVTVRLAYLLGKQMGGEGAGLAGAALAAVDLLSVGFSAALLTETPFTLLMTLGLWLCTRLMQRGSWGTWALLGVVWGLAVYFRASALWGIIPLTVWTAAAARPPAAAARRWRAVGGAALAVALVFAVLSPWLIRNYQRFGSGPLRLTTLEGISLYEAVYPEADGGPRQGEILQNVPPEIKPLGEAERNDEWARRAWGYVRSDPARMARLALIKMGRFWSPIFNASEYHGRTYQIGMLCWHVPLYILGLVGLLVVRGARSVKGLLLVPVVYFTAVHALFLGSVRYRAPLMPVVCVLAGLGLWKLITAMRRGKPSPAATV